MEGELGDGCTALDSVSQRRRGNNVDITMRFRRQGEVCTMILQFVNQWVPLDGPFAPGDIHGARERPDGPVSADSR